MLTKKIRQEAEQLGILDLAEKLYTAVSAFDGIDDVTFDFSGWEPDFPALIIIAKHHMPADCTLRQRHRIVRPVEKIIKGFGLLQTQWYGMDDEHLYFYYRTKTAADYTLFPNDFGYGFVPTAGELQQLQAEFDNFQGNKEEFCRDFHNRSRQIDFYEARADVIARLMDQLSETDKRHREELAAKDSLIADLRKALEKAQNS